LIDLHTHTTASDGRCTPSELVDLAAARGVTVLSVTDHDTVAGCREAEHACDRLGLEFVSGIEITAVREQRDVHVLGYFLDTSSSSLLEFLGIQRERRIERLRAMLDRLASCGVPLDTEAILAPALEDASRAAGRPWIARELVRVGHVASISEAFERWLATDRPAFVPRTGALPREVFERIHEAGGIASLAHPGLLKRDAWLDEFAAEGLDALETHHTKHTPQDTEHYLEVAARLSLAVSGGSDFHGDDAQTALAPGAVSLPRPAFEALRTLHGRTATSRASASGPSTSS
jgi:predicted metal-dependent phosphoesterase TrpH